MISDLERTLHQWAAELPASSSPEALEALIAFGEGLREGVEIPQPLKRWALALGQEDIVRALDHFADGAPPERAAAMRAALVRIWSANGWDPLAVPRLPRSDSGPSENVLPEEVVVAYVQRGALCRYVESVAAKSPAFAEELRSCIDAMNGGGTAVSDVARTWRRWQPAPVVALPRRWNLGFLAAAAGFVLVAPLVGGGIIIKGQLDRAKALEAQLNNLNAERDDLQRKLGSATTDEERARIQAELDAMNSEIENMKKNPTAMTAKPTAKHTGPAVTVPKKPQCHMLDGTKVASCGAGDSLCTCD
jgi:hypothetical protein